MRNWRLQAGAALLATAVFAFGHARASDSASSGYREAKLVADTDSAHARATDPHLVNPWGMAFFPNGAFWINDNGTGLSTLYDGKGHVIPVAFVVPAPAGQTGPSAPTGIIINTTTGFLVPGTTTPAAFLFATEDGTLSAWAGGLAVNPLNSVLAVDNSASHAVYKGLEMSVASNGAFLYATNFHAGRIDVFDSNFQPAGGKLPGKFVDPLIPAGYAPFGIRNIDGNLFVTYAKQDSARHDDVAGPGHGYVDVFNSGGELLQRLASGGALNSPWGIARAPAGFGALSNLILIGNFGDGRINAFTPQGKLCAVLSDEFGQPIVVPGLWGLSFGGAAGSEPGQLYFTAGPGHESHGLFGKFTPVDPLGAK